MVKVKVVFGSLEEWCSSSGVAWVQRGRATEHARVIECLCQKRISAGKVCGEVRLVGCVAVRGSELGERANAGVHGIGFIIAPTISDER